MYHFPGLPQRYLQWYFVVASAQALVVAFVDVFSFFKVLQTARENGIQGT